MDANANNQDLTVEFSLENIELDAGYNLENENNIDADFLINAAGTVWGSISGTLSDQEDLQAALDLKADKSELDADMAAVDEAISNVQTVVENNYNTLDTKIDNVQSEFSGDISTLEQTVTNNNTAVNNRIDTTNQTVAELSTTVADNNTAINNRVDGIVNSFDGDISALETAIQNEATTRANNDTLLQGDINTLRNDLTGEISNRVSADNTLQDNIDTLASDLADEVTARENADTTLQGNINTLSSTVTSNYNTLDGKITNLSNTVSSNYTTLDTKIDNTKTALDGDISDLSDTVNQNYTDLNNAITTSAGTINSRIDSEVSTLNTAITTENTQRQTADNNLQSQIDAITSASDVFDIVGTYAELQAYDITSVPVNDIIKVLVDSTHNNAATYYRCVENDGVKTWTYIGSEGAYYTKSEADNKFVEKTTTINNKPLSSNITLTASDINALPADTVIGAGVITLQKNGTAIDSFNVNATAHKSINITVATDTSDLTNGAGYITASALNGYATETWVGQQGYLTAITSSDVTTALGYTPYNSTNPDGFITSADLPTNYVTVDTDQNITGVKTFVGDKKLKFKATNSSSKMGFTAYDSSNREVGYLEAQGNGNASHKCRLGVYDTNTGLYDNVLGFEYYKAKGSDNILHRYNLLCPPLFPSTTDQSYYIPMSITNGTLIVYADNTGTVDISTLLPDTSNFVTNSSLATTLADYALAADIPTATSDLTNDSGFITSSALSPYALSSSLAAVATSGSYNDLTDKPYIPSGVVVDQTFDGTSANAQSGAAIAGELSNYALTSDIPSVPLIGVQVNSTDLTIENGKVNIPVGTSSVFGVGRVNNTYGVYNYNNYFAVSKATDALITAKTNNFRPIVPSNIDLAVKTGMTTNTLTLTAAEQSNACTWLGAQSELVSGTNIKTINNQSILGAGNIDIQSGGGGAVIDDNTPSTTTVYSSQKTQDLIDALLARIMSLESNINGGNA